MHYEKKIFFLKLISHLKKYSASQFWNWACMGIFVNVRKLFDEFLIIILANY